MRRDDMKTFDINTVLHGMQLDWGFCVACGADCSNCEPDTKQRRCPDCGRYEVYGAEELFVMGLVTDENDSCPPMPEEPMVIRCYCCNRLVPRDNSHNTCLGAETRICDRCATEASKGSQPAKITRVNGATKNGAWRYRFQTVRSYQVSGWRNQIF